MNEWTGELDHAALDCAGKAIEAAISGLKQELGQLS
jgi:hypothetical protein